MKEISIRGRKTVIPSFRAGENLVIVKGSTLRVAEVFDEYWVEAKQLPHPNDVIARCRNEGARADLFTFAQRVPDSEPRHPYYHEWDNIAVIPLSTYEHWLAKQVTSATRRNIRGAENRGVVIRACEYDDTYVRGIMAIYNESPIRQGRRFWHYGKPFEAVRDENGTYADRATFLGAFIDGEMVGYLKMVWDERTAAIMQIMSKLSVYDKRPNNGLMAEAVRQACARGVQHLLYESFVYGHKTQSSLTDFKRSNGFARVDVPRYYVPLTWKGAAALRLGLHRDQKDRLPAWLRTKWPEVRANLYRRMYRSQAAPAQAR